VAYLIPRFRVAVPAGPCVPSPYAPDAPGLINAPHGDPSPAILVQSAHSREITPRHLEKQGLLAFTSADPSIYEQIREDDRLGPLGLGATIRSVDVGSIFRQADGSTASPGLRHSDMAAQIAWFTRGLAHLFHT
jgi:hypothetical protein